MYFFVVVHFYALGRVVLFFETSKIGPSSS